MLFIVSSSYLFPCQRWLATDKDDGQISRELVPVDMSLKRKLSRKDSSAALRNEIALEIKGKTQKCFAAKVKNVNFILSFLLMSLNMKAIDLMATSLIVYEQTVNDKKILWNSKSCYRNDKFGVPVISTRMSRHLQKKIVLLINTYTHLCTYT